MSNLDDYQLNMRFEQRILKTLDELDKAGEILEQPRNKTFFKRLSHDDDLEKELNSEKFYTDECDKSKSFKFKIFNRVFHITTYIKKKIKINSNPSKIFSKVAPYISSEQAEWISAREKKRDRINQAFKDSIKVQKEYNNLNKLKS